MHLRCIPNSDVDTCWSIDLFNVRRLLRESHDNPVSGLVKQQMRRSNTGRLDDSGKVVYAAVVMWVLAGSYMADVAVGNDQSNLLK